MQKPILIPLADLREEEPFKSLLHIDPATLEKNKRDMNKWGFGEEHPIVVWKGKDIIVDGHTRYHAVKELYDEGGEKDKEDFGKVPCIEIPFKDEREAVEYVAHHHVDQRRLTAADIMHLVDMVDKRSENWGGPRKGSTFATAKLDRLGRVDTAQRTADYLGISKMKVSMCRKILDGPPKVREAVEMGHASLHEAYFSPFKIGMKQEKENARERRKERIRVEIEQKLDFEREGVWKKARYFCILLGRWKSSEAVLDKIIEEIDQWSAGGDNGNLDLDLLLQQQYIKEFHETRFIAQLFDVLKHLGYKIEKPAK